MGLIKNGLRKINIGECRYGHLQSTQNKLIHSHTYRIFKLKAKATITVLKFSTELCTFLLGGQGACAHIILVLRECIWNASAVLLVFSIFDNTSSLGSFPHRVVYNPSSTLGECLSPLSLPSNFSMSFFFS